MNKSVKTVEGEYTGLPSDVYNLKPAKSTNFTYSYKMNDYDEPNNIIEKINDIFNRILNKF